MPHKNTWRYIHILFFPSHYVLNSSPRSVIKYKEEGQKKGVEGEEKKKKEEQEEEE